MRRSAGRGAFAGCRVGIKNSARKLEWIAEIRKACRSPKDSRLSALWGHFFDWHHFELCNSIKVSFLHLGQQSRKLTITVSARILVRVLFPQTRQRAQKDSLQWAFMCAFGKAISLRSSSGCDGKWISAAFIPLQQRSDFCIAGQKRDVVQQKPDGCREHFTQN